MWFEIHYSYSDSMCTHTPLTWRFPALTVRLNRYHTHSTHVGSSSTVPPISHTLHKTWNVRAQIIRYYTHSTNVRSSISSDIMIIPQTLGVPAQLNCALSGLLLFSSKKYYFDRHRFFGKKEIWLFFNDFPKLKKEHSWIHITFKIK